MSPKFVDKAERKQQILLAAATVFAKNGYQRTTLDQIAEAAGFAKGTLYLYFKSKEDLFYALFESFTQEFLSLDQTISEQSPLAKIEIFLLQVAEAIDQNEQVIPLTLEFWSICGLEETRKRFGQHYAAIFLQYRGILATMLNEAKAQGEIPADVPVDALAASLLALIDGLLIQQWTVPDTKVVSVLQKTLPYILGRYR